MSDELRFSRQLWQERRAESIDPQELIGLVVDTVLEYDAVIASDVPPSTEVSMEIQATLERAEALLSPEELATANDIITQARLEQSRAL